MKIIAWAAFDKVQWPPADWSFLKRYDEAWDRQEKKDMAMKPKSGGKGKGGKKGC